MQKPSCNPLSANRRYQKKQDLSNGAFGFVQLAEDTHTGQLVAIKFLERADCSSQRYVEAEILNHRHLRHPHIVEFKEVFLSKDHIGIVMEYAAGGTLLSYLQRHVRLQEDVARWFFQQLIIALDFCHRKGVVNRDIKLENTLLLSVPGVPLPLLKLCDFGYSKANYMSAPKSRVGTLAYMAPEIVRSAAPYDGRKADVWSAAVMLYAMLIGSYPFDAPGGVGGVGGHAQRLNCMMDRILEGRWTLPEDVTISEDCRALLAAMLSPEPDRRPSMQDLLKHRWFKVNLPPRALTMNDSFLGQPEPVGLQTVAAIKKLLQEAQEVPQEEVQEPLPCGPLHPPQDWDPQLEEPGSPVTVGSLSRGDGVASVPSNTPATVRMHTRHSSVDVCPDAPRHCHHQRGSSSGASSAASEPFPSTTSSNTITRMHSRLADPAASCQASGSGSSTPDRKSMDSRG